MAEILAEAGRITGPVTEISDTIAFGLLAPSAKLTGQKPMRFIAPAGLMTGLSDGDPIVVRFHRADSAAAGPVPVASLSRA
jgi:hypothetical protein